MHKQHRQTRSKDVSLRHRCFSGDGIRLLALHTWLSGKRLLLLPLMVVAIVTSCDDGIQTIHTFNISAGTYRNDSLGTSLQIDTSGHVSVLLNGVAIDSTSYLRCDYYKSDYTNFGYSSLYEFCEFNSDSLNIGTAFVRNPGIVAYRYIDCEYEEYGVVLDDFDTIQTNGNNTEGIAFVRQ